MKLNTVNVIEYEDDTILQIASFTEDKPGIKEAEDLFTKCIKENCSLEETDELDENAINDCISDGYFKTGSYQVFLSHSSFERFV